MYSLNEYGRISWRDECSSSSQGQQSFTEESLRSGEVAQSGHGSQESGYQVSFLQFVDGKFHLQVSGQEYQEFYPGTESEDDSKAYETFEELILDNGDDNAIREQKIASGKACR